MRRTLPALACALLALAVLATPVGAAGKHVTIKGNYIDGYHFKPKTTNIIKGKTVHWSWTSDEKHNVTFGPKLNGKHSATTRNMDSFLVRFNTVGTYNYKCTMHGFTGKVVVRK